MHLPISSNISQDEIVRLCLELQPTVMISLPTVFVVLADLAHKQGVKFEWLRMIGYIGEQMSDTAQKHVRDALGVEHIRALGYSSADAGLMGYACAQSPAGTYHLPGDFQFLEILDPQTGEAAQFGEQGEFVVTSLGRTSMPLVRYRIGDVGRFVPGRCPCGDPNPRFVLEGRAGNDFKLGDSFISMQPLEDVLAAYPGQLSLNFQVEIQDVGNQVDLVIHVESPDPEAAELVLEQVGRELRQRIPEFEKGLEAGVFSRLEVQPVPLGALPRNASSGKVKRLLDRRTNAPSPAAEAAEVEVAASPVADAADVEVAASPSADAADAGVAASPSADAADVEVAASPAADAADVPSTPPGASA